MLLVVLGTVFGCLPLLVPVCLWILVLATICRSQGLQVRTFFAVLAFVDLLVPLPVWLWIPDALTPHFLSRDLSEWGWAWRLPLYVISWTVARLLLSWKSLPDWFLPP